MNTRLDWIRSLLPASCVLCNADAGASGLCSDCLAELPIAAGNRCITCAVAIPAGKQCGRCLHRLPHYDRVVAGLDYVSPVDYLVTDLKYSRNLAAARALAYVLTNVLDREPYPDIVLPMPIAPSRLRERGFNQAREIALHACSQFGLRLSQQIARRVSFRGSQTELPWRDRARNVRNAFVCDTNLSGETVAVVDDVMTTGATLNELARELKRAGAASVVGWMAARTPPTL